MFTYSKDGITVSAWLDTRKINAQGKYPVKIRVNYKRVREFFPAGKSCPRRNGTACRNREAAITKIFGRMIKVALKS